MKIRIYFSVGPAPFYTVASASTTVSLDPLFCQDNISRAALDGTHAYPGTRTSLAAEQGAGAGDAVAGGGVIES